MSSRHGRFPRWTGAEAERGSAVAEFTMVTVLLSAVFLAILQLGLTLHIRNTVISCASEGARLGARAGADPAQGAQRTRELIAASVSERYAGDVTARVEDVDGVQVVVVNVSAPLPVLGPFGPSGALDVDGRAFLEEQ